MAQEQNHRPRWVLYDEELRLVSDFAHLTPKERPAVFCPACERQVIMKLGKKVVHHFAHKADCDCVVNTPESALHLNAKVHIGKALENAKELLVSLNCQGLPKNGIECPEPAPFPLVTLWDDVQIECKFGTKRPDIGLFFQEELICAIEICATHPIPDEKIELFEQSQIAWIEVRADDSLFEGPNAWTPQLPLTLRRGSPIINPPEWTCLSCVADKRKILWGEKNYTRIRCEKIVDLFFPSGRTYRELFRIWEKVVDGELVELWLTTKNKERIERESARGFTIRLDKRIGQKELAPITQESKVRLGQALKDHLFFRENQQGAIVDSTMSWRAYNPDEHEVCGWYMTEEADFEETYEPLLSTADFPERYVWSERKQLWFIPPYYRNIRWDNKASIRTAERQKQESLTQWKKKRDEAKRKRKEQATRAKKPVPENPQPSFIDIIPREINERSYERQPELPTPKKIYTQPEGTCLICSKTTSEWWYFDGTTNTCKCNECRDKGIYD